MKILQICSKIPFPPKDGGSIAMNILTDGLINSGNQVDVLAINTPKHFYKDSDIDQVYRAKTNFQSVFINTEVKILQAFLNLFSSKSYNISRFYCKNFENELIKKLGSKEYDVIQLETLWVTPYVEAIRKSSKAKIVLRSQNVEYKIWERLAADTNNFFKQAYMNLLAKRLKKYEIGMINSYDAVLTITEIDSKAFVEDGCVLPIMHVPFGIDLNKYKRDDSKTEKPSVFHIGAMDWLPNSDGVSWFLKQVWPSVSDKNKEVKLYLAGRNMPQWLNNIELPNVINEGEVDDAKEFINSKSIMIVPLASGGGMRVKIIEGMALGKTIISTSVGAEGIAYTNEEDIIIADTPEEFINALLKCLNDLNYCEKIASNGVRLVQKVYDNKVICDNLSNFYKDLIK